MHGRYWFFTVALVLATNTGLSAQEFKGKVVRVSGEDAIVSVEDKEVPPIGARASFLAHLSEKGPPSTIATGEVTRHSDLEGLVVVRIFRKTATGDVKEGNLVLLTTKIDPMVAALIRDLDDPDEAIRLRAAKSLGRLGRSASAAIPALERALKDSDEDVCRVAASSLDLIRGKGALTSKTGETKTDTRSEIEPARSLFRANDKDDRFFKHVERNIWVDQRGDKYEEFARTKETISLRNSEGHVIKLFDDRAWFSKSEGNEKDVIVLFAGRWEEAPRTFGLSLRDAVKGRAMEAKKEDASFDSYFLVEFGDKIAFEPGMRIIIADSTDKASIVIRAEVAADYGGRIAVRVRSRMGLTLRAGQTVFMARDLAEDRKSEK